MDNNDSRHDIGNSVNEINKKFITVLIFFIILVVAVPTYVYPKYIKIKMQEIINNSKIEKDATKLDNLVAVETELNGYMEQYEAYMMVYQQYKDSKYADMRDYAENSHLLAIEIDKKYVASLSKNKDVLAKGNVNYNFAEQLESKTGNENN